MISHIWPISAATAATSKPPQKHKVATNIAQRGPRLSTAVPKTAADMPSMTMPKVNGMALKSPDAPRVSCRGSLNTLQEETLPIARCIESAAGGQSHLLHHGLAMI